MGSPGAAGPGVAAERGDPRRRRSSCSGRLEGWAVPGAAPAGWALALPPRGVGQRALCFRAAGDAPQRSDQVPAGGGRRKGRAAQEAGAERVSHSAPPGAERDFASRLGSAFISSFSDSPLNPGPLLRLDQPPFRLGDGRVSFSSLDAWVTRGEGGRVSQSVSRSAFASTLWFSPLETESSIFKTQQRRSNPCPDPKQAKLWGHILNFPGIFKCPDAAFMGLGMFYLFLVSPSSPTFFLGDSQRWRLGGGGGKKAGRLSWNPLPGRFSHSRRGGRCLTVA